ncbi:MAG: tetratricopeptide repeat protein [Alphaproteobacteria bacterium]|jgi:hypothetical protein|nr:tetratricopeptide repeat protein [Alphaproteobacteria bacterium]HJP21707.1 tetratricopeptide repeat protein [Alphaproteobacteria bacterium]
MPASLQSILLALMVWLASGAAVAGTAEALAALARGDHEAAVSELSQLAGAGDGNAQYHLARLYLEGRGVERNPARALELYRQAARRSNISAWLELAELFAEGDGVAPDPARAYFWYLVLDRTQSFAIRMYADAARTALEDEVSAADLARARKLAAAWLARHGEGKE